MNAAESAHLIRRAVFDSRATLAKVARCAPTPRERCVIDLNRNAWSMEDWARAYMRRQIIRGRGHKATTTRMLAYLRRWALVHPWVFGTARKTGQA